VHIGVGAAGIDYELTFDGETNDGVLRWMEDEDYFEFTADVLVERLIIRSPDTHRWAITVTNLGALTTTDLGV
jgi:hypothetical protein